MADEYDDVIPVSLPYDLPSYHNWCQHARFYHPLMAGSIDGTDTVPHDKAIIRASKSKYTPNKKVCGDAHKTVMVRHLSRETKQQTIVKLFSRYGELNSYRLVRDIVTGKSKGYAFVEFKHERDARAALRESIDLIIDGQKVVVDTESERVLPGWIPRRFGGGFGGRKESGQLRFGGIERPFRRPIPVNSKPLGSKVGGGGGEAFESQKRGHHNDDRRNSSKRFKQ